MKPLDLACRGTQPNGWNCGAEAGEPCKWDGWQWATRHPEFHAERELDAAGVCADAAAVPSREEFDRAVEASGLV